MCIRKEGSALISSIIVLSLMSLLGCMYYKMTKYNIQLEALNYNHSDRYNMSKDENEVIYKFMKEINKKIKENQPGEEEYVTEETLNNIDLPSVNGNIMKYNIETHRFILKYHEKDNSEKYRDIDYKLNGNKIILMPAYIFEEKNIKYDD